MVLKDDVVSIVWNPVKADEKSLLIFECLEFVDSCVIIRFGYLISWSVRLFVDFGLLRFHSVLFWMFS